MAEDDELSLVELLAGAEEPSDEAEEVAGVAEVVVPRLSLR